jgi:hypothetical protein
MMLKLRFVASAFILVSILTSCSSDPYENAGKCETPGDSKSIDERVAICTGIEGKSKWYFEGKYFDETLLLAKAKYWTTQLNEELDSKLAEKDPEIISNIIKLYDFAKISLENLSVFANNNSRWDGLLESKSQLDAAEEQSSYLFRERVIKADEFSKGKISQAEAYAAQVEHNEYMNGTLASAKKDYEAKLGVMASSLSSIYSINDDELLTGLLLNYVRDAK